MCGLHLFHGSHLYSGDLRAAEAPLQPPPVTRTTACPQCRSPLGEDFVFCPRCGAEVLVACPACHRAVRADWTHCPYCGTDLLTDKSIPAVAAQP